MNRSGSLYRLIRSMTQSEKRYFTLRASAHGDSTDYSRMFKVIDEKKIFDDAALKKELKNGIQHFAVKKIQLYDLLLKSLRNFHEGRSFDFTLKEMMLDASILSDKALYHDCYSILIRAKRIAYQYEEWKVQLEILHKEYTIIQYIAATRNLEKEILRFNKEEKKIIEQLNNYGEMSYLAMTLRMLLGRRENKHHQNQKSIEKLMKNELLRNENMAISMRSKSLYCVIKSAYFLYHLKYEKAEGVLKKHISLYEKHPHFISASPGNYLNALHELLIVHFRLQRFEEAAKVVQQLQELAKTSNIRKIRSSRFKMVLLSWTLPVRLAMSIQAGTVKTVLQNLSEEEEYFVRHASSFESQRRAEIFLAFASCYFELGDHKKAIFYIQKIFRDSESPHGVKTLFLANMLQVIIHFEEENFDLLDYLVLSLKRMTARNKQSGKTEELLSELADQLLKINREPKKRDLFSSYMKKFEHLKQDRQEQPTFDFFDITGWLKRKQRN